MGGGGGGQYQKTYINNSDHVSTFRRLREATREVIIYLCCMTGVNFQLQIVKWKNNFNKRM